MPSASADYALQLVTPGRRSRAELVTDALRTAIGAVGGVAGTTPSARRNPEERRAYARDPVGYFRDILGWELTDQQRRAVEAFVRHDRLLIPSGNNLGKTFLLAGLAVFTMDALAALPDPDNGLEEQGARVLLSGPDHNTVFETLYAEMLTHAARAERRGFGMPGTRSEKSVLWTVRPKWGVEVFAPPRSTRQAVKHTASGRHHRNQSLFIEEGQGVEEAVWRGGEGMCSSEGNKIASPFNPTEPIGPAFQRSRDGTYAVVRLDAFQHPNILQRTMVVTDAISFRVIDTRVRAECRDRGPYPDIRPDPAHHDFIYALPPFNAVERGPRLDGQLGHPDGELRVYRPGPFFLAQVRGEYPTTALSGLFNPADIDRAMARWKAGADPETAPDRVGVDPAREGKDDPLAAPAWGDSAGAVLSSYADALLAGTEQARDFADAHRIRLGRFRVVPKGDGVDVATWLDSTFPDSPFISDDGGVGTSPNDHLARVLGRDVLPVSFAGEPLPTVPDEPVADNMRTQLYLRLAMLLRRDLVDLPDDPILREELLAHELKPSSRSIETFDTAKDRRVKKRVTSHLLIPKDDIKKVIGRSPDRADAAVLAVHDAPRTPRRTNFSAAAWRRATHG